SFRFDPRGYHLLCDAYKIMTQNQVTFKLFTDPIDTNYLHIFAYNRSAPPSILRHSCIYRCGRIRFTLDPDDDFRLLSSSTSFASSSKSATRKSARCPPMTISGSGGTRSVHCGGIERTVTSSTRSRRRFP